MASKKIMNAVHPTFPTIQNFNFLERMWAAIRQSYFDELIPIKRGKLL